MSIEKGQAIQILNRVLKNHFPRRVNDKLRREILGAFVDGLNPSSPDFIPTQQGACDA